MAKRKKHEAEQTEIDIPRVVAGPMTTAEAYRLETSQLRSEVEQIRTARKAEDERLLVIQQADLDQLQEYGAQVKAATLDLGEKYLTLCRHIRAKQIAPKIVTETLKELGFHKVRISEINRVSQCADELWNDFEAKALGFRKVLQLERGGEPEDVSGVGDGEGEGEGEGGGEGEGKAPVDEQSAKTAAMARAAKILLNAAEFLNLKSRTFTLGNGWTVVVTRDRKTPAKKPAKQKSASADSSSGDETNES